VADGRPNGSDYRIARQRSALALVALVVLIVVADSLGFGGTVDPLILAGLLVTAAGLVGVDLPGLHR